MKIIIIIIIIIILPLSELSMGKRIDGMFKLLFDILRFTLLLLTPQILRVTEKVIFASYSFGS